MISLSFAGILVILAAGMGGNAPDIASLLPANDYFASRNIDTSVEKMMELASAEPTDPKTQIGQLLALRVLGADPAKFKGATGAAGFHKVLEEIANGTRAQDKHGFSKEYAARALAQIEGTKTTAPAANSKLRDLFSWFPADSDIVFGLDVRGLVTSFPASSLDVSQFMRSVPPQAIEQVYSVVEKLGNIEIDRVSFADMPIGNENYLYFRVAGKFTPAWLLAVTESFNLSGKGEEVKGPKGETILIPNLVGSGAPAVAIIGDTELAVAFVDNPQVKSRAILNEMLTLRAGKGQSVVDGRLKSELQKIPEKALAIFVGEVPPQMKANMARDIGAAPDKVIGVIERGDKGFVAKIDATMANPADAKTAVSYFSKGRDEALTELKRAAPQIPIPNFPLVEIQKFLEDIEMQANNNVAHFKLFLTDDLLKKLPSLLGTIGLSVRVNAPPNAMPVPAPAIVPIGN